MAVATETVLKRSTEVEDWLESHGTDFELKEILVAGINERRSLQNQARFQALDEHLVATYAEAAIGGAQFPPIVVSKLASGEYLVIDGNHRVAAHRLAERTTVTAYVLKDPSERLTNILTFDANTRHGMPTSPEERKAHAVYLVDTAGVPQKEAARMLNVPHGELQYELSVIRTDRRLARLGVDRWMDIGRASRARLGAVTNDKVLLDLAGLIPLAKISAPQLNDIVVDINKQTTEADQLAVVEAARETFKSRIKMTVGGRSKMPRSMLRLQRTLSYAESVAVENIETESFDTETKQLLADRIAKAITKLEDVLKKVA